MTTDRITTGGVLGYIALNTVYFVYTMYWGALPWIGAFGFGMG